MDFPHDLKYTATHEWIKILDGQKVLVGLTSFAQHELGDIVFVNLPAEGSAVTVGETLADVESVKTVADIICPASGTISTANQALLDAPEKINEDPYQAWICEIGQITEYKAWMSSEEYARYVTAGEE